MGIPPGAVRGRLGRPHDGRQTHRRRRASRSRRCGRAASTPVSASSETGRTASSVERRAHELGVMRDCLFLGYQEDVAPFFAVFDALVLLVRERGDARERDRGARGGAPVVATRVGGVPDVVTRRRGRLPRRAGRRRGARRAARAARARSGAAPRAWARRDANGCCRATRSSACRRHRPALPLAARTSAHTDLAVHQSRRLSRAERA